MKKAANAIADIDISVSTAVGGVISRHAKGVVTNDIYMAIEAPIRRAVDDRLFTNLVHRLGLD